MSFESVKQNGPVWQPTHTGTKKANDIKHLEAGPNSYIEGYYFGCITGQGPENNSTIHKLKGTKVGDKTQVVGEKTDDSGEVSIWGTTVLNDDLGKISVGEMIRVVWLGKKAPKKGSNHYHDWSVLVDKSVEPFKGVSAATPVPTVPTTSPVASPVTEVEEDDSDLPF